LQALTRSSNLSPANLRQELILADVWLVLRKRKLILAGCVLTAALAAMIFGLHRGKLYTATGELQIQPGASSDLKQGLSAAQGGFNALDDIMESDTRVLESETLLNKVVESLKLQDNAAFLDGNEVVVNPVKGKIKVALLHGNVNDPFVRVKLVRILRKSLTVNRVPRTQMITISYSSRSPELSASIVNELESEFIKNNFVVHYGNKREVSNWLTGQMDDLRHAVQNSQDKMVDLQRKLGISALDPNHSVIVQEITNLEKSANDATQQRVLLEARYQILQSISPDQILDAPTPIGNEGAQNLLTSLRAQRANGQAELAKLQPVYGPNYPVVRQVSAHVEALNREIAAQQQRIILQARDAVSAARVSENQAKSLLETRTHELYGQRDDLVQYELLSQEYESNRQMYEKILSELREAAIDAGLESADISVVDLASLPVAASSTSTTLLILVGGFAGFMVGLIAAVIVDRMDTRINDSTHVQEVLGLPGLAIIPHTNWKGREDEQSSVPGPELLWDPRSAFSESFRVLRTSIQLSSVARQSRVIAVTSCQPAEGKSTIATNLAAVLAQSGKKVLLIDCDMRRPSIFWRLGLQGKQGLSEFLTGNCALEEVIQPHQSLANLDLIPSGFSPPLPADLLASEPMKELVLSLRQKYDYVLFDSPPVLSVTDPLIVAALADGIVLVVRQGYCTRAMLSRAAEIIHEVDLKVYGYVLNGVNAKLPEYYGYLGYYAYDYKK
jgi:capsular exopolysaccharide synthesis family protein